MTQVDFYVLGDNFSGDRYSLACRLVSKVWQQGRRIYLNTNSEAESKHMDRLLWTFREDSFIPHSLHNKADHDLNPVLIGHSDDIGDEHDVLLNLATEVPTFFSSFERVTEIIDNDSEVRRTGRVRFRFYRDRGYPITTHEI